MLMSLRILAMTVFAMIAFAANSVIGREGLLGGDIGAGSFALIRLVSGAALLLIICGAGRTWRGGDWTSASALFVYAAFFSYAYLAIGAGAGALILFATVQIVMLGAGWARGERLSAWQALGLTSALGAFGWWLSPGAGAPSIGGTAAMVIAGAGWALYSLRGLKAGDPVQRTAGNFLRAALLGSLLLPGVFLLAPEPLPGARGISLAVLSGAITSGLGYVVWYAALRGLTAIQAGAAQLTVPVIAAGGGVILLGEPLTTRFSIAALIIIAGVALTSFTAPQLTPAKKTPIGKHE